MRKRGLASSQVCERGKRVEGRGGGTRVEGWRGRKSVRGDRGEHVSGVGFQEKPLRLNPEH